MENTKSSFFKDRHPYQKDHSPLNFWQKHRKDLEYMSRNRFETSTSTDKRQISYFKDSRFKSRVNDHSDSIMSQRSGKGVSLQSDRLSRMKNILKDISNQQDQHRHKLREKQHLKSTQEESYSQECTFVPQIRHNPKYQINSKLEERNKSWDEVRIKNYTSKRQQIALNQVKQCTFNPNMMAYERSKKLLKKKQLKEQRQRQREIHDYYERNDLSSNQNNDKSISQQKSSNRSNAHYGLIKQLIRSEIYKLDFNC